MVRPAGGELRTLLAVAAVVFVVAAAVSNLFGGSGLLLLLGAGLLALLLLLVPISRFSTHPVSGARFVRFAVSVLVFQLWNAAAFWVTFLSSTRGIAAGLLQASAAIPLVAGVVWLNRR